MGHESRLSGLRGSGHVLVPGGAREQSGHGVQVPPVPSGAGRPAAGPAGAVGRPGGPVPGPAGSAPPDRHGVRLCSGLPSLRSDGDGVAVVRRLSDAHLHRDLQLGLRPLGGHSVIIRLHAESERTGHNQMDLSFDTGDKSG